jgi:hypothetical protein
MTKGLFGGSSVINESLGRECILVNHSICHVYDVFLGFVISFVISFVITPTHTHS